MLVVDDQYESRSFSTRKLFGTEPDSLIWLNTTDGTGLGFASFVVCAMLYSFSVTLYIVLQGEMAVYNASIILVLVSLAIWSHMRTMMGDPGAVPPNAHPLHSETSQIVCGRCECYKPPHSHHGESNLMEYSWSYIYSLCIVYLSDRVSKRCISRMDHFCPWMNNAIGAKNQKNFFLFLIYTDISSIYMYIIVVLHLVRVFSRSIVIFTLSHLCHLSLRSTAVLLTA